MSGPNSDVPGYTDMSTFGHRSGPAEPGQPVRMFHPGGAYLLAARLVENIADDVEAATHHRDLTPAQVAEQAGISTRALLAIVAGDRHPTHHETIALLRWLAVMPRGGA